MTVKPAYFEPIRLSAARRWDQLEQDPDLAGPWHQLFKQVQSPRHILSELLQNADDAGATEATVRIENQIFIFEHNGEDFSEEHFASLCRFGYSNKRALHTIGFRGIGFKSTFSLGDCVELSTPTLAISYDRKRFTEPRWLPDKSNTNGKTLIRVEISDLHRQKEVEKNLEEWLKSPVSLLFFKNIRRMQIGDRSVHWRSLGVGPVPDSEWMSLSEKEDDPFLLIRSEEKAFPDEALTEIRQERMLGDDEDTNFPPCKIEIVLGAKGRLFVVLPTGVETELPFACNAPFIQDPARMKIKDPETSPTNRWLLDRAGRLGASAMLSWLGNAQLSVAKRAAAYRLFPDVNRDDATLEGVCGTIVEEAFAEAIESQLLLLTDAGILVNKKESVILPDEVIDIWPAEQAAALLDEKRRPALCQHVKASDRKKLLRWDIIDGIDKQTLLAILRNQHLPKPKTWGHLLTLWAYITPEITGYSRNVNPQEFRILPVQGKDVLYAASEVVRLGEKKLLQSEEDWGFLATHLIVLNQNWPRFLAEQRRTAADKNNASTQEATEAAYAVLRKIGLEDSSNIDKVIDQVAATFFGQGSVSLQGCIQLAQIAAKIGAKVGDSFRYATRDLKLRSTNDNIMVDEDGNLEVLLPKQQRDTRLLHPDYAADFSSCTREEWLGWVASGRAGLLTFVPFIEKSIDIYGKAKIEEEARRRGLEGMLSHPYVGSHYVVEEREYDDVYWRHWHELAVSDDQLWVIVAERILSQRESYWSRANNARLLQVATTGNMRVITHEFLLPGWVLRLRDLPCLPDTRGFPKKPGDLLRRTPETESLIDVEPFINGRLDKEATRPLLELLGVRSSPTGPDRLLACLQALSKAEKPPIHEVEKWYLRLDQMINTCSTSDFQRIKDTFQSERLVLTEDSGWATSAAVFLSSDEDDVPDAAVIRSSVGDLTLWRKIGIAERPTADLAIQWMKTMPSGQVLSTDDAKRVRALLVRHPARIWDECAHWLNLAGEWSPVEGLSYSLTMQSLVPWRHLHQWVKQKTADLQRLPVEVTGIPPFSTLSILAEHVEDRFHHDPQFAEKSEKKAWLTTLGMELRRVEFDSAEETQRIRAIAERLEMTSWQITPGLEIIPYIEATPAGTPRQADVLWLDQTLYVDQLPKAKLAKRVPGEIGKAFGHVDIKAALDYSFERLPDEVREYLEENFKLAPRAIIPEKHRDGTGDTPPGESQPMLPDTVEETPEEFLPINDAGTEAENIVTVTSSDEVVGEEIESPGEQVTDDPDEVLPIREHKIKPAKPNIVECYAKAQGFRKDTDDRFFHDDGSWIGRASGDRHLWERRVATGELVRYYWAKDHCLERDPLQLEADIWGLIEKFPESYALILSNPQGEPVEVFGGQVRKMLNDGFLTLYPATYRLVYNNERG